MKSLRILTNPRKSMQRFGFLKLVLSRANINPTNSLRTLGDKLVSTVTRELMVPSNNDIREYISHVLREAKYKTLRSIALKEDIENRPLKMEIQDYFLADGRLKSRRGKLNPDDWNRYPQLAVELGLLRGGTYSSTTRGQLFLSLVSDQERDAFERSDSLLLSDANPLILSTPQILLLLYSLIEADGDAIIGLYRKLLALSRPFTLVEAGNMLPEVYRTLAKDIRGKVKSGDDSIRIQRLLDTAKKIEAIGHVSNPGGKNPREHAVIVRLEPFVDMGILTKTDPFGSLYEIPQSSKNFFESLIQSGAEEFLNSHFFSAANHALYLEAKNEESPDSCLKLLTKSYEILKNPVGYSPITDVCLLASIRCITNTKEYLELSQCSEALKLMQKEKPHLITFNVDRWGKLRFVKLAG